MAASFLFSSFEARRRRLAPPAITAKPLRGDDANRGRLINMVALRGREIDAFLARPDAGRPIILLYGPDAGLVRERADALLAPAVDPPNDPFSLVRLAGDHVAAETSRLVGQRV